MSRPGRPLTKKSILLQSKMAELEKGDKNSNTLLANVLDMDDDFIAGSILEENDLCLQAAGLGLVTNKQPRSNAWLDVDHTTWSFPYKSQNSIASNGYIPGSDRSPGISPLPQSPQFGSISHEEPEMPTGILERELQGIRREISVIADKIRADAAASQVESEWKFAAMVLDRLCLLAFTAFTVILSAAALIAAPHVVVV